MNLEKALEWTCEANPGTLTAGKAVQLRQAGVNRLSIGAQSFDDSTLSAWGASTRRRRHASASNWLARPGSRIWASM